MSAGGVLICHTAGAYLTSTAGVRALHVCSLHGAGCRTAGRCCTDGLLTPAYKDRWQVSDGTLQIHPLARTSIARTQRALQRCHGNELYCKGCRCVMISGRAGEARQQHSSCGGVCVCGGAGSSSRCRYTTAHTVFARLIGYTWCLLGLKRTSMQPQSHMVSSALGRKVSWRSARKS
jgi:hypothetical protein